MLSVGFCVVASVGFSVGACVAGSVTFSLEVSVTAGFEVSVSAGFVVSTTLVVSAASVPAGLSVLSVAFVPDSVALAEAVSLPKTTSPTVSVPAVPDFWVVDSVPASGLVSRELSSELSTGVSAPIGRVSIGADALLQAAVIRVTDVITAAVIRRLNLYLLILFSPFLIQAAGAWQRAWLPNAGNAGLSFVFYYRYIIADIFIYNNMH